ncbi:hypothetical protein FJT64_015828 [Amphibalanus amphitrite]|uniref:Uncharacterized protein n=1 Tax=Amphibalanus amphitrite TaxID=1232801 RepID=A0A6A4X1Y7_AMPAM|nr:hypothetical protein FJT64_015828 [Amphibalanus amphitrite]
MCGEYTCFRLGDGKLYYQFESAEHSFVAGMFGEDIWIGFNDIETENRYVWANGATVDFTLLMPLLLWMVLLNALTSATAQDNFPCEQGGSACPSGQTCGGECGPNTCCRRLPSCDRPDAYIAEPCGVEGICLPCEAASDRLCCRRQPNTLEDCRRHCRRERGKECYLFGCPKGAGWCCRNPTPL